MEKGYFEPTTFAELSREYEARFKPVSNSFTPKTSIKRKEGGYDGEVCKCAIIFLFLLCDDFNNALIDRRLR